VNGRRVWDSQIHPILDGKIMVPFWLDEPGDPVIVAETRVFRGKTELVINWRSRVAPAGPAELPHVDPTDLPLRRVSDISLDDDGFRLETRVVRVRAKAVSVGLPDAF
jgi:hypothetical protein